MGIPSHAFELIVFVAAALYDQDDVRNRDCGVVRAFIIVACLSCAMPCAAREISPPPENLGRYPGEIVIKQDLRGPVDMWGFTEPGATDHDRCVIHTRPVGYKDKTGTLTSRKWREPVEHETGHCFGLIHDEDDQFSWSWTTEEERKENAVMLRAWWNEYSKNNRR